MGLAAIEQSRNMREMRDGFSHHRRVGNVERTGITLPCLLQTSTQPGFHSDEGITMPGQRQGRKPLYKQHRSVGGNRNKDK